VKKILKEKLGISEKISLKSLEHGVYEDKKTLKGYKLRSGQLIELII